MAGTGITVDGEVLIERMNDIRNLSEQHVSALHHEAHRVTDWREHVRSKPLIAVAAAAVVGYSLFSGARGSKKHSTTNTTDEERDDEVVAKTSVASGMMAFVGSLASAAVRSYATNYFRRQFQGSSHDRYPGKQVADNPRPYSRG